MQKNWPGLVAMAACGPLAIAQVAVVEGRNIQLEFDRATHSRVIAVFDGREHIIGGFVPAESIAVAGLPDFSFVGQKRESVQDELGAGSRTVLTGTAGPLQKTEAVTVYDAFPRIAFIDVGYTNTGRDNLRVGGWTTAHYVLSAGGTAAQPAFWSYQSGSYEKRPDWVLPLTPGFKQDNYMGMNASDYGGGTPVVDVWRRDVGIAVGHLERAPKLVSLPVSMIDGRDATVAVEYKRHRVLKPGETMKT